MADTDLVEAAKAGAGAVGGTIGGIGLVWLYGPKIISWLGAQWNKRLEQAEKERANELQQHNQLMAELKAEREANQAEREHNRALMMTRIEDLSVRLTRSENENDDCRQKYESLQIKYNNLREDYRELNGKVDILSVFKNP